jgi:hypothetical protein
MGPPHQSDRRATEEAEVKRFTNAYNDEPMWVDPSKAQKIFPLTVISYAPDGEYASKHDVKVTRIDFGGEDYVDVKDPIIYVLHGSNRIRYLLHEAYDELEKYKDDAVCDHSVGICACDYIRLMEELKKEIGADV